MTNSRIQIVAVVLLLFSCSMVAFAHAILLHSSPSDQAVVHRRNIFLTLDYNSRIDASRSTLSLTRIGGQSLPVQMESGDTPSELKAIARNLPDGKYKIHWQVLATDGHITRGDIAFTVAVK